MTNPADGTALYTTGQLLPNSPFFDGFVYAIQDHKLIFWWHLIDDPDDYTIEEITVYYYSIGKGTYLVDGVMVYFYNIGKMAIKYM